MHRFKINGRRGAFQLLFAAVYLVVGISFLTSPDAGTRHASLSWLTSFMPLEPLSALWFLSGLVAAVSAFLCRPNDWVGFSVLVFAPAVWGALFFIGGLSGTFTAFTSAAVYWLFAAAPMVVSGMQGPTDRDRRGAK